MAYAFNYNYCTGHLNNMDCMLQATTAMRLYMCNHHTYMQALHRFSVVLNPHFCMVTVSTMYTYLCVSERGEYQEWMRGSWWILFVPDILKWSSLFCCISKQLHQTTYTRTCVRYHSPHLIAYDKQQCTMHLCTRCCQCWRKSNQFHSPL